MEARKDPQTQRPGPLILQEAARDAAPPPPFSPLPPAGRLNAAAAVRPRLVSSWSPRLPPDRRRRRRPLSLPFIPFAARGPFYASPALAAEAVARRRQVTSCGCTNMHFISFLFFFGVCVFVLLKDEVFFHFFFARRHQPLSRHQSPSIPSRRHSRRRDSG